MRKSEHTELATLSRLAVLASREGLNNITYGNAASAAHLSRGAMQRLFPDKATLQASVLAHAVKLMRAQVFEYDHIKISSLAQTRARWAAWISGDAGLPGGCVLIAAAASRGYSVELQRAISSALEQLLSDLSTLAIQENLIQPLDAARFKTRQLGLALALHVTQFLSPHKSEMTWVSPPELKGRKRLGLSRKYRH